MIPNNPYKKYLPKNSSNRMLPDELVKKAVTFDMESFFSDYLMVKKDFQSECDIELKKIFLELLDSISEISSKAQMSYDV